MNEFERRTWEYEHPGIHCPADAEGEDSSLEALPSAEDLDAVAEEPRAAAALHGPAALTAAERARAFVGRVDRMLRRSQSGAQLPDHAAAERINMADATPEIAFIRVSEHPLAALNAELKSLSRDFATDFILAKKGNSVLFIPGGEGDLSGVATELREIGEGIEHIRSQTGGIPMAQILSGGAKA